MRIAPDVERLMWMVAESADSVAVQDFESRFPELRYELSKRIDMVRELKASRKIGSNPGFIPRFEAPSKVAPPIARWKLTVGAVAMAAIAFGSYYGTQSYMASRVPRPPTAQSSLDQPALPPAIRNNIQVAPRVDPDVVEPSNPQSGPTDVPSETGVAEWDQPQNVKFSRIRLKDALVAIAAQSGLKIDMGPGMPNPEIQAEYRGMTGIEILADMGAQFGFTPFSQGNGQVIVIPARDERADAGQDGVPKREGNEPQNRNPEVGTPER